MDGRTTTDLAYRMLGIETIAYRSGFDIAYLVHIYGDVDTIAAKTLRTALSHASELGMGRVIALLDNCKYFDSSGLAVLIAMRKTLGARLKVVVPHDNPLRHIFDITGLVSGLQIVASIDEAFEQPVS